MSAKKKTTTREKRSAKKRVVIIDDHPVVRQGLTQLLNQKNSLEVCGEAEDAAGAFAIIHQTHPDAAIVDLTLKKTSGLELIKDLKIQFPKLAVLVLSMHDESVYAERALRAGAMGYIMKQEAADKVLDALSQIFSGKVYVSDAMASKLLHKFVDGRLADGTLPTDILSDRELEVYTHIGRGFSTQQIAKTLHLSVKTIETYRAHIKEKMDFTDASELLQQAIKWVQCVDQV